MRSVRHGKYVAHAFCVYSYVKRHNIQNSGQIYNEIFKARYTESMKTFELKWQNLQLQRQLKKIKTPKQRNKA
jgi:hypothetical protein